ncbi:DegT/DnrJ/EryC1/StrS family aminotransferase [Pontibacter saemangeumensis]|uniref:DegT/DnrJ/EryC1/StrS family aminotransferase n=1 Tax=Pontibacter saemangeumensis TaxID=1084525 RepID=A0ABP8LM98_9BACT
MEDIRMVDQKAPYARLKSELDAAFSAAMASMGETDGQLVKSFGMKLGRYLNIEHVFPCASSADALKIALLAQDLPAEAEVIVPAFGPAAGAEAVKLLGLKPVFADVLPETYMIDPSAVAKAVTPATAAIMPVHLFGQCAPMQELIAVAKQHHLWVVEDTVQSLGAVYVGPEGREVKAGTMGHIGVFSFFPPKAISDPGDAGAVMTNDARLSDKIRDILQINQSAAAEIRSAAVDSRMDVLQAAMLEVKIKYLDEYHAARQEVARFYDNAFAETELVQAPHRVPYSSHIYQQYAITVAPELRDGLQEHLRAHHIPSVIYYPLPLHLQDTFAYLHYKAGDLPVAERLSKCILSLPMHSELKEDQLTYICQHVLEFVKRHR